MYCFDTLSVLKLEITHHWWVKVAHHFLLCNIMAESKIVQLNLENSIASYNVFNIIFMYSVC